MAPSDPHPSHWSSPRVRRPILAAVLLLPALALADADPRFARLRDQAEPLGSLATFLDKYVGECATLFSGPGCRKEAEDFRARYEGKKVYMIIREEAASMLSPGPYQPSSGKYVIQVSPIFPGGPYSLTQGEPKHLDVDNQPLLPFIQVTGSTPEGWAATDFMRLFQQHKIRAQVVFTPQRVWLLTPREGGGKKYGVAARVDALLLTDARTGEPLGTWFPEGTPAASKPRTK